MLKTISCNISNQESHIRAFLAAILMLLAFIFESFMLGTLAVALFFTAYTRFCPLYRLFHSNEHLSRETYYLSLLPKYNTSPIFIFDGNSKKVLFQNHYAKELIKGIESFDDIVVDPNGNVFHIDKRYLKSIFKHPSRRNISS